MKSRLNAFIEKNKHAFLLLYFCIYFPWFHHLERTVTTHFHVIHTALDDLIPFCEYFIVPYLLWFGYVAWAVGYFYFKNKFIRQDTPAGYIWGKFFSRNNQGEEVLTNQKFLNLT